MLSIVPDTARIKAAALAAVLVAMCAACGSSTTESARPITPVSVDCGLQAPGPNDVDGVFTEIPGFTVTEICPSEIDPSLVIQEFGLTAGIVSQNGNLILRVLAGQLKSGSGDAFVRKYLGDLADKTRDGVGVPSETEELGRHVVRHFNIPLATDGYVYADGLTVAIAYVTPGSRRRPSNRLTEILDNLG